MTERWRVERAGTPTGSGYLLGWIASSPTGVGAYFRTHAEAIEWATREADAAFARDMRRIANIGANAITRTAPRPLRTPEVDRALQAWLASRTDADLERVREALAG